MTTLQLIARQPFHFPSVVNSHGWRQLAPFRFEADLLYYVDQLSTQHVVEYQIALLGRSNFIPVDSWALLLVSQEWYKGKPVTAREVEKRFAKWGEYKGLAFWFWDWKYNGG